MSPDVSTWREVLEPIAVYLRPAAGVVAPDRVTLGNFDAKGGVGE